MLELDESKENRLKMKWRSFQNLLRSKIISLLSLLWPYLLLQKRVVFELHKLLLL